MDRNFAALFGTGLPMQRSAVSGYEASRLNDDQMMRRSNVAGSWPGRYSAPRPVQQGAPMGAQAMTQRMAMMGRGVPQQSPASPPQRTPWAPRLARLAPDNQADAARANQLDAVLMGHDMRFGPNSPESMFKQNVIRQPGQMGGVVHPMMPSTGGPMPQPRQSVSAPPSLTNQQAIDEWNANEGQARGRFMEMTPLGISSSGNAYVPNQRAYATGLNSLMGRLGQGPSASFNDKGEAVDMAGNPLSVEDMRLMSSQARSQLMDQKISGLRNNARIRNAVTDAQRGRLGPLLSANAAGLMPGNVLNAMFPQPAPFIQVGPGGQQMGGMAGPPAANVNDPMERMKMALPFLEGLPAQMKMQAIMGMMGQAAQGRPINIADTFKNIQQLHGRAAAADRAVTTPQAGDAAGVPDGVTPDEAFRQVRAANPNWHINRVRAAVASKYPGFKTPGMPFGHYIDQSTGQSMPGMMSPDYWAEAFGNLFGGGTTPRPKAAQGGRPMVPLQGRFD